MIREMAIYDANGKKLTPANSTPEEREAAQNNSSSSGQTNTQAETGMFGLENIMKSFYDYQPDSDDEYGNYMKNTFASNMIQSAFDTQNAKDLSTHQAELSSALMGDAADRQLYNTKDIMRKEYQYGSGMMKQQFQYQNEFANDQYDRDLGTMSAMGQEERKTAQQQQRSDQKIASGRYKTDKQVANKQLQGTKYSANKQLAGIKDTNKAQLQGTKITAQSQLKGTKYTANQQLKGVKGHEPLTVGGNEIYSRFQCQHCWYSKGFSHGCG